MRSRLASLSVMFALSASTVAQPRYKLPDPEIVRIIDAPPTPFVSVSPNGKTMLLVEYVAQPPVALLARPIHRIGGIRIDAERHSRQHLMMITGIQILSLPHVSTLRVELPKGSVIGSPVWADNGRRFAFTRDTDEGLQLWWVDVSSGKASQVRAVRVNDVLGSPIQWLDDGRRLLVSTVPASNKKPPVIPRVPDGPAIDETAGKVSKTATYQDLLKNPGDEKLFEYYATSQLAIIDVTTGGVRSFGPPAMYTSATFSPNGQYVLTSSIKKPFSYRVPYYSFSRAVEVWDKNAKLTRALADLPVADDVPTQGVPTGPREFEWNPSQPATVVWTEALDGGDPLKKVPHREIIRTLSAPFSAEPGEIMKLEHRFSRLIWTGIPDEALITEYNRDRRWTTTAVVNLKQPATSRKVLFDLSANDAYNNPGFPVTRRSPGSDAVARRNGDWIYFSGRGATEQGDRPFLDRLNTANGKKERLFRSAENRLESFVAFAGDDAKGIIVRSESATDVPNYYLHDLASGNRIQLTKFLDPAPQLTGMKRQLMKYNRPDGVSLSGTLYYPPGYRPGTRLPLLVWAYPLEYSDAATAGQVRTSPHQFTFFRGVSPLFFAAKGYAVLMDATMPVVGDPETMNNTFIEQIVASAKAAIDTLDAMGVIDRKKTLVSGHSYGAFMTANLLAHSDLFAAGVARSGAYNRTLTPFGFQSERRSFWEAKDIYLNVSPFAHADKINEPILLVHGEADNNSGTFPIQSERLFQAIRGNGGTAKLIMLPYESHGYSGRESVLHVIAEMLEWGEKYVRR